MVITKVDFDNVKWIHRVTMYKIKAVFIKYPLQQ